MKKFLVVVNKQQVPILTYAGSEDIKIGDLVIVPFKNSEIIGIIIGEDENFSGSYNLKEIIRKFDISIPFYTVKFIDIFSKYYLVDPGSVFKMMIPIDLCEFQKYRKIKQEININLPELNKDQAKALAEILSSEKVSVLQGVTGSGKTEVYFHLIEHYIKNNRQILLMLPEIGLTKQVIDRFQKSFGFKPAIWHSGITKATKRDILYGVSDNSVKVVIGTRSSLFLPFKDLALIIVDEEHDSSYKQEEKSLYNARDSAVLKSSISDIKVVLVSATPSIETYYNIKFQKYHHSFLPSRFGKSVLPNLHIVDMKKEEKGRWISKTIINAIANAIENNEQTILFINRRGYAPLILCKDCGYRLGCKECSSWLVYHKNKNSLICHHCGYTEEYKNKCQECGSEDLVNCGPGVERVYEEVLQNFPNARVRQFTSEDSSEKLSEEILSKMENGEIDILVGTQIISKGYHFPKVTVVGVIDADMASSNIDLKSSERCFQILTQVSGRSGRENKIGHAYLQSYNPTNEIFRYLISSSDKDFYECELESRNRNFLPPFSRVFGIIITGSDEFETKYFALKIRKKISPKGNVNILGPAPATMSKIRGKYRFRILIISDKKLNIQKDIDSLINQFSNMRKFNLRVEVDPYSFY